MYLKVWTMHLGELEFVMRPAWIRYKIIEPFSFFNCSSWSSIVFGRWPEDLCYINCSRMPLHWHYAIQGFVISLGLQITNHRAIVSQIATRLGSADNAQQHLNKCLYYVNIGSNDYINNYFLPQFYPTSHIYSPEQYAEALIEELSLNLLVYIYPLSTEVFCVFHFFSQND